jgi:phosphoribosylanthranilate isomerase
MWIKICGLTTPAAATAAVELKVDAAGFVFAASPRRLSLRQALELARPLRGRTPRVAVMLHPTQAQLDEILEEFDPDVLQSDAADLQALCLPATLQLLPVVREPVTAAASLPARLLFEGAASGSGRTGDWGAARALAQRTELVLAGGLHSGNVAAAIAAVRPFGVDVSSGVEERPGVKSPAAMEDFVRAARAATDL